jgi:hypothetical protein
MPENPQEEANTSHIKQEEIDEVLKKAGTNSQEFSSQVPGQQVNKIIDPAALDKKIQDMKNSGSLSKKSLTQAEINKLFLGGNQNNRDKNSKQ